MRSLWLLRHGQTDWNLEGRWQGQTPIAPGLNAAGRSQAIEAGHMLRRESIPCIYSSDLLRARQTAEWIAGLLGARLVLEPRLREIHLGEWEGMLGGEIASRYPLELAEREADPMRSCAPGGESVKQVADRVWPAVDEIISRHPPGQSILIVSHGIALGTILCRAEQVPLEKVYKHIPENGLPSHVYWKVCSTAAG